MIIVQEQCDVVSLDAGVDYRKRNLADLAPMKCYYHPITPGLLQNLIIKRGFVCILILFDSFTETKAAIDRSFTELTKACEGPPQRDVLEWQV